MNRFDKRPVRANYNEPKMLITWEKKYCKAFEAMLDTADYVPEKYRDKIIRYVFKRMKKALRRVDAGNRSYQKGLLREAYAKWKAEQLKIKGERGQK